MASAFAYSQTRRLDLVEDHFGQSVSDPYRWLEQDIRNDAEVAAWAKAQNAITQTYLATLPGRDVFKASLQRLFDHERVTAPWARGGHYFYTRQTGLQNQPALVMRSGLEGPERVLIDPNDWSSDGTTAMGEWAISDDGSLIAYSIQQAGTDWRSIKVFDVNAREDLADEVMRARFMAIAWTRDNRGFFYSRYPDAAEGESSQAGVQNHAVYYHALGTPQAQDRLVYATPDKPHLINVGYTTDDGRYLVLLSTPGPGANALAIIDLEDPDWTPRQLIADLDADWHVCGNVGPKLYVLTNSNAERKKIVSLDISGTDLVFADVVAQQDDTLSSAVLLGGKLLATYLVDAKSELRRFALDGTPEGTVELPGIGTVGGFRGELESNEVFFVFTSYNIPTTIYRYDVTGNTTYVWARPDTGIDLDRISVEQRFYPSKDGTRIPMFIVRRKDVTGPAPTLLYAYGGFGISMIPYYAPPQMAWVEQGGVSVVANIRGGGEYGKSWHDAGRFANRQNAFDDFIAAGEYLKAEGITTPDGLAVQGESNGGLLMGAVVNQRPDLFAAALPGVGVMDMLRFPLFTGGALWMEDFGDPRQEKHFHTLRSYSPYHNIASGKTYPAILVNTADTDDRVIPGHSFKYVAALQAADIGDRPHLLRVEAKAGHGAGKPMHKVIEETADQWAFIAHWTGLNVKQP